jgi:DNA-binding SARP family transcriptional activator/tetratricopeptide (TPR) repeat protein
VGGERLVFRILGSVEAGFGAARPVPLNGKQRALLAVLLLEANRVVAIDQLADAIWGRPLPAAHETRIRSLVSELRKAFATDELIATRRPGYVLRIEPEQLDLERFTRAVEHAREAAAQGQPALAAARYDEALGLWRGAALGGVSGPFLDAHVVRLEELRLRAVEERIDAMLGAGRHAAVITDLRRVTDEHPLRERPHGQLMTALYRAGRRSEALDVYRDLRARLVDELGLEPTPELQRLQRLVLAGDAALTAPGPVPAPKPVSVTRQLPADAGRFVGRRAELARLHELSAGPDRLVLVVGPAGAGKTTFAVHWAHDAADRFPDGQLFLDMRGFERGPRMTAGEALAQLLQALGVPADEIPVGEDAQTALFRSALAGRRFLVVLDNVAEPGQVRPLLPGEADCLVLVTSRDRLGGLVALDGARRLTLDVLPPDDAVDVLAQTAGADLVEADRAAAAELARLCGHLPLALRILAGRVADQPERPLRQHVTEFAAHGRVAQLRMAGDDRADVRGAFELSYRVLAAEAQRLFRLLGLVPAPAGWSSAAVGALAAVPVDEAGRLLDTLARLHLVKAIAADRYDCHDLLLEYAAELAAAHDPPEQRDAAVRRLLDFYLYTTDHAATLAFTPTARLPREPIADGVAPVEFTEAGAARGWVATEWDNLAAAQRHAAAHGPRAMAWQLADALRNHLYLARSRSQRLSVAETGLAAALAEHDQLGEAAMRYYLGLLRYRMADFACAAHEHEVAAKLYHRAGWPEAESAALRALGAPLMHLGQVQAALERFQQALTIDRATGNRQGEAANLNNIASVYEELGELAEAARHLAVAIPLLRDLGRRHGVAIALANLGTVAHAQGDLETARTVLSEGLDISRDLGYREEEAETLVILGQVHRDTGRFDDATAAFDTALDIAQGTGDPRLEILALNGLASVEVMLGRPSAATTRLSLVLDTATRTGHHRGHVDGLLTLCYAACSNGLPDDAHQHASEALALATEAGSPVDTARAHAALAAACLAGGRFAECVAHAERALAAQRRLGLRLAEARTLRILTRAHEGAGEAGVAEDRDQQARTLAGEIGTPYPPIPGWNRFLEGGSPS